jgi:hypothetical protein
MLLRQHNLLFQILGLVGGLQVGERARHDGVCCRVLGVPPLCLGIKRPWKWISPIGVRRDPVEDAKTSCTHFTGAKVVAVELRCATRFHSDRPDNACEPRGAWEGAWDSLGGCLGGAASAVAERSLALLALLCWHSLFYPAPAPCHRILANSECTVL